MGVRHHRHSDRVTRSKRWRALRLKALRRDGWRCVKCGSAGPLEVDHIESVRTYPDLAFDLTNLQSLCPSCHARKTRLECGHPDLSPQRRAWRDFLKEKNNDVGIR
jgi:5-methylcytosine-specific restriction protein A